MADVKKINLFPTTIYSYKSEITDAENKLMLDYIYGKFDNKYKEVRTGEGVPFGQEQGEDNLHFVDAFQPLVKFAEALSYNIFKEEGYLHQDVEITQMWSNKQ